MPPIPRETGLDHSLALLREGYDFIGNRCARFHSDIFETRLMLRRAACLRGPEAAELFYGDDRFTRKGAMPISTLKLLQDFGSVQMLDGEAHRQRKRMFLSFTGPQEAARLSELMAREWTRRLARWQAAERIVLFDESRAILTRAVLAFAGIPFDEGAAERRNRELSVMIEGAGAIGPRNWRGQWLRMRSEAWARGVIRRVRAGTLKTQADAPVRIIAAHRDLDGRLLSVAEAAIELLNLLRPTVAVAHFIVFAALALHLHPQTRRRIVAGDADYLHAFVEEVRRTAPFFPLIGGRVRQPFAWRGHRFARGDWVLLDLYGTNHDPRRWPEPHAFRPERLIERPPGRYDFVPQGGGEAASGHRCPGEGFAVALTKTAVRLLTTGMRYDLPAQDLTVDLARMPALPKSGFVIANIRPAAAAA